MQAFVGQLLIFTPLIFLQHRETVLRFPRQLSRTGWRRKRKYRRLYCQSWQTGRDRIPITSRTTRSAAMLVSFSTFLNLLRIRKSRKRKSSTFWSGSLYRSSLTRQASRSLVARTDRTRMKRPLMSFAHHFYNFEIQRGVNLFELFAKHQPGAAGCGWLQPGRNFLST